jgi:hypothetical protein
VLRFVGEDERGSKELTANNGNESPSAATDDPAARLSLRLGSVLRPFRRSNGRRSSSELVSPRWSPMEELQLELDRSRRFGHRFALICIESRLGSEARWTSVRELGYGLSSLLRRVDRVWIDGTSVYLLLPECDRSMVESLLERLRDPLSRLLAHNERSALFSAVFPDDGMTSGALLRALKANRHGPSLVGAEHRSTPAA